ncbi:protein moonraker isoform X2 [Rhineura floridana]|uniref:protein moonraker isoform X2 n=1 Tax=Rhineura floridana TaxID=261503 RepID=UPI002AC87A78|nr:protein moonraker isoform X2 [Rhineura floridana]
MGPRKPVAVGMPLKSHPQLDKSDGKAPQSQTQLHFSRHAPALPDNLVVRYCSPRPIVIEKLVQPEAQRDEGAGDGLDLQSSVEFSVVSEEKLNLAVQLARRDVKRKHLEERVRRHLSEREKGPATCPRGKESARVTSVSSLKYGGQLGRCSKVETTGSGARVYLYTPSQVKSEPSLCDSPPTHDPGPGPAPALKKEEDRSTLEVRRLQKELQNYIRKIEELVKKEKSEEILDPDEERRVCIRRQEQAVRSARMLYVLQQQVKEIQEDLEKLSPRKIKHTKKSRAMARLAAAHRGAIRALQVFATHFADQPEQQPIPAHCKELGNLIRQLSLCSAQLEMDSSIPDVVIDLLLQVEDLDSLLSRKESPKRGQKCLSASQAALVMEASRLPKREKKACALEPWRPPVARRLLPDDPPELDETLAPDKHSSSCNTTAQEGLLAPEQEATVQAKWEAALGQPRSVKAGPGPEGGALRKRGVLAPTRPQGTGRPPRTKAVQLPAKQARFQEPTISFRLKETKPPVRESRAPWMPPSLASPLTSPQRDDAAPPAPIAEMVEQAVRERLEPLLAKAQAAAVAAAADVPNKDMLDFALEQQHKEFEREALATPGNSDLEAMLRRLEEIERSQEAVRRRYNRITYSDPEFWAQEERWERENAAGAAAGSQGPGWAPHPIQMTKQESHKEPQADIVLERPLDTNAAEEEDVGTEEVLLESRDGTQQPSPWHAAPPKEAGIFLSVPKSMLQSIRDYGTRYEQHLKCISHEEVGNFNPWQIAESLAEELTEEALADVATELQGLCEDYAEAVFTSEFLQAAE